MLFAILRRPWLSGVLLLLVTVAGCRSNEGSIIALGEIVFVLFLGTLVIHYLAPMVQRHHWTQEFVRRIRPVLKFGGYGIQVIGLLLLLMGLCAGPGSVNFLFACVGAVICVGGRYLAKWSQSDGNGPNDALKMVSLSIAFAIALLWLIFQGISVLSL